MSRSSLFMVAGALTFALSAPAIAKVYYIDNVNGNDTWPGTASSPVSGNGPWRSFTHLAVANKLLPGDSVLLRCGGKWSETLRLNSSGTAAAPIRIGSYPDSCATKPAIDGAQSIPASAWVLHSGNIYKTKLGTAEGSSLIVNGALTTSFSGWRLWSASNNAKAGITTSCPESSTGCLAFTGGSSGNSFVSSSAFPMQSAARYRVTFSIRAPAGGRYGAYIRRTTSPWDTLGLATASLTGTGTWQTVSLPFTASSSVTSARLDLQLYQPLAVHIKDVRVTPEQQSTTAPASLVMVTQNGNGQPRAHHPNRGHNPALPDSPYLLTAAASATVIKPDGSKGSDYLVSGGDLRYALQPGLRLVLRNTPWSHSEHTVSAVSGSQIHITPATMAPLEEGGWGYYLTGALWMLDSPGEWHYDASSQTLYAWSPAGDIPGDRFAYSSLSLGIDINRKQNIVIEGLAVRNAGEAVYSQRSQNAALRRMSIRNIARHGINGEGMVGFELSNSQIGYTGFDALYAPVSTGSIVRDNDIEYAGLILDSRGKPVNFPLPSFGAIRTGSSSVISGNRLRGLPNIGIAAGSGSQVTNNAVTDYCRLVNDCAGIYFPGANGGLVTGNLVTGGVGNLLGIPARFNTSLANGLYLDLWTTNVTASDNTFGGGDFGIQLHDGYENRLERNVIYSGRGNSLWLQESKNDKRSTGNIYGNVISQNAFFSTNLVPALRQSAYVEDTHDFATYQGNAYSNLLSTVIAAESAPNIGRSYQLPDWQTATDTNGIARNLDSGARIAAPLDGFASGLLGSTIVANGDFSSGTKNWTAYNATMPWATVALDNCGTAAPRCLRAVAGGSDSNVASPAFSVTKGQWYRVSFDAQIDASGQMFRVKARQAGGGFAGIMNTDQLVLPASTTLKRYSFVFQSLATLQLSATSIGARVDFMDIKPGRTLRLANFEVVPLTLNSGVVRHALLSNPGRSTINVACPTETAAPAECSNYYLFPQGTRAVWPATLAPLGAQIVFSQNAVLPDADRDGVGDSQDSCSATAAGQAANAKGCALGQ